jgi:hypothetical protein
MGESGGSLADYKQITLKHVEWTRNFIVSNPSYTLPFFRLKFKEEWGQDISDEEIDRMYDTVLNHVKQMEEVNEA